MNPIRSLNDVELRRRFERLERQTHRLRLLAGAGAILSTALLVSGFNSTRSTPHIDVLDVERINIREPDGTLAVVIANQARMPGNIIDGLEYSRREGVSGLLFYNSEGDEAGGLVQSSARNPDGSFRSAFGQLSLDRFESDQMVAVRYWENQEYRSSGVMVSDYPRHNLVEWAVASDSINRLREDEQPAARQALRRRFFQEGRWEVQRLFVGQENRTALLELKDTQGRSRIRLAVDSLDVPVLEFLDPAGSVVFQLPER
jgi:hypothetical protein